ncbi:MAG: molybdopterin-dependent oxidoreductase [Acidimicrobiia bacterium]
MPAAATQWHRSACILCSINCGIEVRLDGRRFERIRGDKAHPGSRGYTCEKTLRLDHYQNFEGRLTSPLRRRADGTFEPVDWDTAIADVAARLAEVRDEHGGASILAYGGGGQGNHLGGGFGKALQGALGVGYSSNALAQEKTGEFWVDGRLFGRPRCHTTGDYERAEVLVFVGKNPWQSHGFPRARPILKAVKADPDRAVIVIDPRRSETTEMADVHLRVRPGTDAWCLSALLAVLVSEGLVDERFVAEHTRGFDELVEHLARIDVGAACRVAGVDEALVRSAARRIAGAESVSIFEDLGIQQAPHSTLNSYLEKLIYLLTGNFAKRGAMNLHSSFASLVAGSSPGGAPRVTPVTGERIITGLIPCTAIPDEILTDHPDRFRAMIVESANPAHSLPDSQRMREALEALDFLLVIDVAFTETARLAHYVLPAASQFEKWEMTFFNLEFPENVVQLRRPLLEPLEGTLPEPEIHRRLLRALGAYTDADLEPLRDAARRGRAKFAAAFLTAIADQPKLARVVSVVLAETLGPTLGAGNEAAAAVWGLAQRCAMTQPDSVRRAGYADGDALFDAMLGGEGIVFTLDDYDETWNRMATDERRVRLVVPELLEELSSLPAAAAELAARRAEFPFVLSAGERRSSTANTIFRDPTWRKTDEHGALRMNPTDVERLGLVEGARVRVVTKRGSAEAVVAPTDSMLAGHVSLPNGMGLRSTDAWGAPGPGVAPNELTSTDDRDWLAGTPWHKHVPAKVEVIAR